MTEFSVLTWNMNHWPRSTAERAESWQWVEAQFDSGLDIALLQETVVPAHLFARAINDPPVIDPTHSQWASAVLTSGAAPVAVSSVVSCYSKADCALQQTKPGAVQIASIEIGESKPLYAVSVYGGWDDHRCADTTMHRILSDLTPLFDGDGWKRTVLGGDLNVSTQSDADQRKRDATVFDRLAALGLVDLLALDRPHREPLEHCWCDDNGTGRCHHVHTHKHARSERPWNNDYLFASHELAERLDLCEPEPDWDFRLSDHRPVRARFKN